MIFQRKMRLLIDETVDLVEEFENRKLLKTMISTKRKKKRIGEKVRVKVKVVATALVKVRKSLQKIATDHLKKTRYPN